MLHFAQNSIAEKPLQKGVFKMYIYKNTSPCINNHFSSFLQIN